ncbi:glycosyltransferase family 25 protein [Agaribacter flavus]|uniref:Glycosyltransferase family 25 protein n=1 Tax=Agaribacter flavus TaxID=1902781 RepID=A0ABV7FW68_9ALTE
MNQELQIFLINLDASEARLQSSSNQLASMGLGFERISAVNGGALSEAELNEYYSCEKNLREYYKPLTPGEIGCYLSHRKAWQSIVDRRLPYALILEDDFNIQTDLSVVDHFLSLDCSFDYIKLSNYQNRERKVKIVKSIGKGCVVRFSKIPAGTCAQIVSYEGAKKLLESSQSFGRPVDVDIQYWWERNIEVIGLVPFPFSPKTDIASDITQVQNRKHVKKRRFRRLLHQFTFKYKNYLKSRAYSR